MKKSVIAIIICLTLVFALSFTACNEEENGTYYPDNSEMKTNLETRGYDVTISTDLFGVNAGGISLSATKDGDYIYFFWLNDGVDCAYVYEYLEYYCENYNSLVKITNDEQFGNIVYCGTESAVNDAGIKVVNVKVDVKV